MFLVKNKSNIISIMHELNQEWEKSVKVDDICPFQGKKCPFSNCKTREDIQETLSKLQKDIKWKTFFEKLKGDNVSTSYCPIFNKNIIKENDEKNKNKQKCPFQ